MDDYTSNTAASVVTGSSLTCAPKILGTGSVVDSEGANAFNLKVIIFYKFLSLNSIFLGT